MIIVKRRFLAGVCSRTLRGHLSLYIQWSHVVTWLSYEAYLLCPASGRPITRPQTQTWTRKLRLGILEYSKTWWMASGDGLLNGRLVRAWNSNEAARQWPKDPGPPHWMSKLPKTRRCRPASAGPKSRERKTYRNGKKDRNPWWPAMSRSVCRLLCVWRVRITMIAAVPRFDWLTTDSRTMHLRRLDSQRAHGMQTWCANARRARRWLESKGPGMQIRTGEAEKPERWFPEIKQCHTSLSFQRLLLSRL